MFSYKGLAGLFMTLTLAAANIDTPADANMCVGQGEGNCQFATFDITDNSGGICTTPIQRQAVIYDHACNQIGWSTKKIFDEGDSIDSQLPYTVNIINENGGQTADCRMKYTISYSDGTYGYGMPDNGAWNSCTSSEGDCSWYRVAFPCPGF